MKQSGALPLVYIIILNWNGCEDTLACLASLREVSYPNYRVLLVDNASEDGSVQAVREGYEQVEVLQNTENLGFAQGNNVGLKVAVEAGADYALLLNNDTVVAPGFLDDLIGTAEADPHMGMAGPTIYYFDRPQTIWSAGGAIDWKHGSTRMLHLDEEDCGQLGSQPRPVDFVTGCALLVKAEVIRQVGLLDARFFAYYEETEWAVRASRAGFHILHIPRARIWHKISAQARETSPLVHYYMTRNRLLFLKCTHSGPGPILRTLVWDYGRTLLSWSVRPRWRARKPYRKVLWRAISDYLNNRFGQVDLSTEKSLL
jgi:GT2 family glycosyltransferase